LPEKNEILKKGTIQFKKKKNSTEKKIHLMSSNSKLWMIAVLKIFLRDDSIIKCRFFHPLANFQRYKLNLMNGLTIRMK